MKTIQQDSKLNRNGIALLDPPFTPRPPDDRQAERERQVQATNAYWDERIKQQHDQRRRPPITTTLRRF